MRSAFDEIGINFLDGVHFAKQVALKRQQAVEDAIALRLASNETGKRIDTLPPGKIFGMSITEPCDSPSDSDVMVYQQSKSSTYESIAVKGRGALTFPFETGGSSGSTSVSENAIDMLAHLFPHRKRSVLELILRRCDLDLLKAIEQCRPAPSAFKPIHFQVRSLLMLFLVCELISSISFSFAEPYANNVIRPKVVVRLIIHLSKMDVPNVNTVSNGSEPAEFSIQMCLHQLPNVRVSIW